MEDFTSQILARLDILTTTMATMATMATKEDLASLKGDLASLENSVATLGSNMASKADVARVSEDVSTLNGRLDGVAKTIAGDRSILGTVEADVARIRSEMADFRGNADLADSNLRSSCRGCRNPTVESRLWKIWIND